MCNLLVPVQAFDVVRAGRRASESVWVRDIVQVGNVELSNREPDCLVSSPSDVAYLALCTTGCQQVRVFGVELESLDSP